MEATIASYGHSHSIAIEAIEAADAESNARFPRRSIGRAVLDSFLNPNAVELHPKLIH